MHNYETMLVIILGNLNIYVVKLKKSENKPVKPFQRHFDYYLHDPQPEMPHFLTSFTLKNPAVVGEIVSQP